MLKKNHLHNFTAPKGDDKNESIKIKERNKILRNNK